MPRIGPFTPARRDILLVLVALGLLLAPIWLPILHLGEPTYRYQRARITVGGENGLAYANNTSFQITSNPISTSIGCSIPEEFRICALEHYAANHTIPTSVSTNNPNLSPQSLGGQQRYRYVLLNGTAYTTTSVPNRSIQDDQGYYRLDLGLQPHPLTEVLSVVSLNSTTEREEMAGAVYRAAATGVGKSHHRVDVPQTPIRIENGSYYRVYYTDRTEPSQIRQFLDIFLPVGAPVIGLLALYTLSRRFEMSMTHRGTRTERWER